VIELVSPTADCGISAGRVTLAADETISNVTVQVEQTVAQPLPAELVFRAVGQLANDGRLVTEARVPLRCMEVAAEPVLEQAK
jgi:hypothetical protein